ncbi:MAG: hypothetical protein HETSPECPRED_002120 [Heterodermia speciosa]|uniref:F-box domain-containing protein n=1 Tax=Heterodermia speciosa TaxID=116794 RepID=A0A8H3PFY5_9LECA|nr:MAG: hypothetical protein HETSPECPRED_002120 [Heterodermia speciosa]
MSTSGIQQELEGSVDVDIQTAMNSLSRITLENSLWLDHTAIQSIGAKLIKAKDTSIDIIPIEILEQILSYIIPEEWSMHESWPNDEYPLLKTLRLVNAAFNKVASPFLFRKVILYENSGRYAALKSIANVPYLAPLVEVVQLVNIGYLPDCHLDAEEREQSSHDCRTDLTCGSFAYWLSCRDQAKGPCASYEDNPPDGGPLAKLDFSPEATYIRYLSWRDGERIMKAHFSNGTGPHIDFELLPNLHHVKTVGLQEMRTIHRRWSYVPETRRFYETGLIEENGLKGSLYVPPCHLPTFIIASSIAGKELTSLTIHRLDELFQSNECNKDNIHLQLKSLRRLRIDLRKVCYSDDHLDDPAKLAPWVHNLESLEELRIHRSPHYWYRQADVIRLLRRISLPKLKYFELKYATVGFKVLKTFLSRHNETLQSVVVQYPRMDQERWDKLKERYKLGAPLAYGKEVRLSKLVDY